MMAGDLSPTKAGRGNPAFVLRVEGELRGERDCQESRTKVAGESIEGNPADYTR